MNRFGFAVQIVAPHAKCMSWWGQVDAKRAARTLGGVRGLSVRKLAVPLIALCLLVFWPVAAMASQDPFAALKRRDGLAPTHYTITSIDGTTTLAKKCDPGVYATGMTAINNNREAVGFFSYNVSNCFRRDAISYRAGIMTAVWSGVGLSPSSEQAMAISNSGYIAGDSVYFPGDGGIGNPCNIANNITVLLAPGQVLLDTKTGSKARRPADRNTLCYFVNSFLNGVNNSGIAVGSYYNFTNQNGSTIYTGPSYAFAISAPSFSTVVLGAGAAYGINDLGVVVGQDNSHIATLYTLGRQKWELGVLGGGAASSATAIADSGLIVGWSNINKSSSVQHAFVYYDKTMYDFGTPIGTNPITTSSNATSVNNFNEFVGSYILANGNQRAFVYAEYVMHDLKSLVRNNTGWTLLTAAGTNDCGDIVGTGIYNGNTVGYLARPINVNNQPKRRNYGCSF